MAQIWIEIEDNENCGYFPTQVFEARSAPETGSAVEVEELAGFSGRQTLVGWCSDRGGSPCEVTVVVVGDSGAGESRLIRGGDHGVRIRPADSKEEWALESPSQRGEPYILLNPATAYRMIT